MFVEKPLYNTKPPTTFKFLQAANHISVFIRRYEVEQKHVHTAGYISPESLLQMIPQVIVLPNRVRQEYKMSILVNLKLVSIRFGYPGWRQWNIGVFPKWNKLSLNSAISENLINH